MENKNYDRRLFLRSSLVAGTLTGLTGLAFITGCKKEEEVSPSEDLMREHGVLNRVLLIYDHCRTSLLAGEQIPLIAVSESAGVIRHFIEDYHEKLEEDYLFPRFEKAKRLTGLVNVLRLQHNAGRNLTDRIIALTKTNSITGDESKILVSLLADFNRMYRPHEAREDTVLFPALRKIISAHEYGSLGEDFEDREHALFGEDGFETMVDKVAGIEKQLGIYDLSLFTPATA